MNTRHDSLHAESRLEAIAMSEVPTKPFKLLNRENYMNAFTAHTPVDDGEPSPDQLGSIQTALDQGNILVINGGDGSDPWMRLNLANRGADPHRTLSLRRTTQGEPAHAISLPRDLPLLAELVERKQIDGILIDPRSGLIDFDIRRDREELVRMQRELGVCVHLHAHFRDMGWRCALETFTE